MGSKDCSRDSFVAAFKYGVAATNLYFRTMRKHGVWIPDADRAVVVHAGQQMVDLWFGYVSFQ